MVCLFSRSSSLAPAKSLARRSWKGSGLLLWAFVLMLQPLPGIGAQPLRSVSPSQDRCQASLGRDVEHLRQLIAARLRRGLPITAQLDEGNARLSSWSVLLVDCEQQHVVASGNYEFRGNLGVMDLTRRGAAVLQFQLSSEPRQRQIKLDSPQLLDVTFDNPAPWFDGKAISTWVLALYSQPICMHLPDGQPC
jgi:hypothetical protein